MKFILKFVSIFLIVMSIIVATRYRKTNAQSTRISRPFNAFQIKSKMASIKPFTITMKSTVVSPEGVVHSGEVQNWSGDATRYMHRVFVTNSKSGLPDLEEVDIYSGATKLLYSSVTKSIVKTSQEPDFMVKFWASQPDPASDCLISFSGLPARGDNLQLEGTEDNGGVHLLRMKAYTNTTATAQVWLAPDFGCAPVKTHYSWKGEGGTTDQDIFSSSASVVESLFTVPDYEQVSPSEFYIREAKATGSGQYAQEHGLPQFATYLQQLKTNLKSRDDYWARNRVQ